LEEEFRQLGNIDHYEQLTDDPTPSYKAELMKLIRSMPIIAEKVRKFFIPENPKPGTFYMLLKIHKQNCSGHAIVSNIDTLTEAASGFIENILKPYAQKADRYVEDTTDLLNITKQQYSS